MKVKITITSRTDYQVEEVFDVEQEGDVGQAMHRALEKFRQGCADDAWDARIEVDRA